MLTPSNSQEQIVRSRKRRRRQIVLDVPAILSAQNVQEGNQFASTRVGKVSVLSASAGSPRACVTNPETTRERLTANVSTDGGSSDPKATRSIACTAKMNDSHQRDRSFRQNYNSSQDIPSQGNIPIGGEISERNDRFEEVIEQTEGGGNGLEGANEMSGQHANEQNARIAGVSSTAKEISRETLTGDTEIDVNAHVGPGASSEQNQAEVDSLEPSDSEHESDSARTEGLGDTRGGNRRITNSAKGIPATALNHWQKLLPCLLINGTIRFTREQYANVISLCNFFNQHTCWSWRKCKPQKPSLLFDPSSVHSVFPSFRTLQRSVRENLLSKLVARGSSAWHNVDPTKSGAQARAFLVDSSNAASDTGSDRSRRAAAGKTKVTVVPISEYARLDLACAPVFHALISTSLPCGNENGSGTNGIERERVTSAIKASECIDDVPLISDRHGFYGNSAPVGVDPPDAGSSVKTRQAEVGDTIKIDSIPSFEINAALLAEFSNLETLLTRDQQTTENRNETVSLNGIVVATWSATWSSANQRDRRVQNNLSGAEEKVMQYFRFNPGGTSNLPWSMCRPGDSYTLLRAPTPVSNENREPHFLVLTHRFLIEGGESSYSVAWVKVQISHQESATNDETDLHSVVIETSASDSRLNQNRCFVIPAFRVTVVKEVEGDRGAAASDPIPSMGFLSDGTRYFIYRFLLFWDGFRVTQGKAASANGVYMVSLNLPRKQRVGIASVRVLSLFPPGVCVQEVFARLKEDILKGMTEGFLDYDSSGMPIRIFLDFVGSVGDTPALNETIDVMGHNAAACCHLCRFIRSAPEGIRVGRQEYMPTSRYTGVDVHGGLELARRDWIRSQSLSDSSVEENTRRRLGFKTKGEDDVLGLHDLCTSFEAVRSEIPKDIFGRPIIPSVLDPYRSLLIGPDHVLFGVGKDCINAALQLISPALRLRYEKLAITAMKDCRIRTQNKLFDRDSGKLLSMGMSDLYCLLFISEYAFSKAVLEERVIGGSSSTARGQGREVTPISSRARNAILVVATFSRVVSKMCYWPYTHIDGKNSVRSFNEDLGLARIRELQENVKAFLQSVKELCTFDQSVPRRLEAVGRARGMSKAQKDREKRALISDMKEANLARTQLDHPNLHRLLELTETVLPAVGHITRISELLFEKAHQEMKRAIKQSNMRNPQLDAVNAALINDWQGRLTMLYRSLGSENTRKEAEIGIFRLLMGREELFARGGVLSRKDIEMVHSAIGPKGTVDAVLEREGRQVITGEVFADETVQKWRLLTTSRGKEMTSCFEYERSWAVGRADVLQTEAGPQLDTSDGINGSDERQFDRIQSQQGTWSSERAIETLRKRSLNFLTSMYGAENFKQGYEVRPLHHDNSFYPESYGVRAGDVVQALTVRDSCTNGPFSFVQTIENNLSHGEEEQVTYWFTLCFFEVKSRCGALVLPCKVDDSYSGRVNNSDASEPSDSLSVEPSLPIYSVSYRSGILPKVLMLDSSCRRVAVLHDCRGDCKREEGELFVRHREHILKTRFYLVDRKGGFPPRML